MRTAIGVGALALTLATLAVTVWAYWLAGHGRHRAPRRRPVRRLLVTPNAVELPYGTEAVFVQAPPAPSVLPLREGEEEAGGDADTVALLEADRADFAPCPAEGGRRTPHFFHPDGSRTCCRCETTTAGDVT